MRRTVAWQQWDGFGVELLEVADGRAVGTLIRDKICAEYEIQWEGSWRITGAKVALRGLESRSISVDLQGATEIDIAACAFTNTLPIRRLKLAIGQAAKIEVAYVHLPELRVERVQQRYTRLADRRYKYEGLNTGFTTELDVDEDGLVIDYPGLCRRVLS
jgi:hypothetical protein